MMMEASVAQKEMPRYKCHKEVWALKIVKIQPHDRSYWEVDPNQELDGGATITPSDEEFAPFKVDREYMRKHNPQVGGYHVVYKDGYKSFSPDEAFEEGYTLIQ
jgi:hypothetical protein